MEIGRRAFEPGSLLHVSGNKPIVFVLDFTELLSQRRMELTRKIIRLEPLHVVIVIVMKQ
jgi:hypothetical protein